MRNAAIEIRLPFWIEGLAADAGGRTAAGEARAEGNGVVNDGSEGALVGSLEEAHGQNCWFKS